MGHCGDNQVRVSALLESGVDYIQIDAPRYNHYVDPRWRRHLRDLGEDPDRMFEEAIAADNFCLEGAQRPEATIAFHICRGNNQSKWYAKGGRGHRSETTTQFTRSCVIKG